MAKALGLKDPTDLDAVRAYMAANDPQRRLAPLGLQRLVISDRAHLAVADAVSLALSGPTERAQPRVVILKDTTRILRDGVDLTTMVAQQLAGRFSVTTAILSDGHKTLHADETVLARATEVVAGADVVVTIGSGTITDIGKVAGARAGGLPLVVVQTAASVDGFTDDVSVVLRNGVKRTVPSQWPHTVLADTVTIAGAPSVMNTAGFGEALSLFTAPADWYLASLVGLDMSFHPTARDILTAAGGSPSTWSAGVSSGERGAVETLTRLLAIRGLVTGISGTTACLSGVEHIVSHMLDLHQAAHGRPIGLHGAQVGIGTIIAGAVWRRAIEGGEVRPERLRLPDPKAAEARVRKAFGHLGDGAIAEECWKDYRAKLDRIAGEWSRITALVAGWREEADALRTLVLPSAELHGALGSAGAPSRFGDLDPAFPDATVRWAIGHCHLMRNRFTLVDLLDLLGLWDDATIDGLAALVSGRTVRVGAPVPA